MLEALDKAQQLLAQREHSAKGLSDKLLQRGFAPQEVAEAIAQCQTLGYQCDVRFAEALCRARLQRGYGPYVMRQLLNAAGVASQIIEQVMDHMAQTTDWHDIASQALRKKFRSSASDADAFLLRQKQHRFLKYRGFTDDTIRSVCDVFFE